MDVHGIVIFGFILILLGLSAFFSGSETALMSVSRLRLKYLADSVPGERKRIAQVESILGRPERLIGTILLGNNLVNISMSALATALVYPRFGERGIIYVTIVLTLFVLVFAEITPKVYARHFDEKVSCLAAGPLGFLMRLFGPAVELVTFFSRRILKMAGLERADLKRPLFTEGEVMTSIKMAWDDGTITAAERRLLSRVFTLNDKTVAEIMVPVDKTTFLPLAASFDDMVKTIIKTGFSRFPVTGGKEQGVVGVVHAKDILRFVGNREAFSMKKIMRPPSFIPHTRRIDLQLRFFQVKRLHQAIVLDERERVAGLVTLEDILEELVGEIEDEHDTPSPSVIP